MRQSLITLQEKKSFSQKPAKLALLRTKKIDNRVDSYFYQDCGNFKPAPPKKKCSTARGSIVIIIIHTTEKKEVKQVRKQRDLANCDQT